MSRWKQARLGAIAKLERSVVLPNAISSGTAYLGLEHIENGGKILQHATVQNGELASAKFSFSPNHVLYGKLRPYLAKIALPDFSGICSTDILPILPGSKLDRRFLCYYLRQPSVVDYANSRTAGANLPRLAPTALADFEIPLPPLEEQKRIADILDKADAIRRKRQEALQLTDEFLRSVFLEMFGDPESNPYTWPVKELGFGVAEFQGGRNMMPTNTSRTDGLRVLKVSAVTGGEYKSHESKSFEQSEVIPDDFLVRADDLLISRANTAELVGAVAYVWETTGREVLPDKLWRFVWDKNNSLDSMYMLHIARSSYFRSQLVQRATGSSGSMKNIGKAKMLEIPIPYPPLELQLRFSKIAQKVRATSKNAVLSNDQAASLFASLQQRAFSGELFQ
jgi:type I restriction enzyme S subunit